MSLATEAEFARIISSTRQYVNRLKRQGRLKMVGKIVDVDASIELIEKTSDPARAMYKKKRRERTDLERQRINFIIALQGEIAGPSAVMIKQTTEGRVKSDRIWDILHYQFLIFISVLGDLIREPEFRFELPEAFDRKHEKTSIEWLDKQPLVPLEKISTKYRKKKPKGKSRSKAA